MTIENFDRTNLAMLRGEIQSALDAVAARHGITLQMKNITFDPITATFRAPLEGAAAAKADLAVKQALDMAKIYGVDASQPSQHPRAKGAVLKEFRTKARGKPWVYDLGGKAYVTTTEGLKALWPKAADAPVPTEAFDLVR